MAANNGMYFLLVFLSLTLGGVFSEPRPQLELGAITAPSGRFERTRNQAVPPLQEEQPPVNVPEIIPVNEIIEDIETSNKPFITTTTARSSWRDRKKSTTSWYTKSTTTTPTTTTSTTTSKPWGSRTIPVHEQPDEGDKSAAVTESHRWSWQGARQDNKWTISPTTAALSNSETETKSSATTARSRWNWRNDRKEKDSPTTTTPLPTTISTHPTRKPSWTDGSSFGRHESNRWNSRKHLTTTTTEKTTTTTTTKATTSRIIARKQETQQNTRSRKSSSNKRFTNTPTDVGDSGAAKPQPSQQNWRERDQQRRNEEKQRLQLDKQKREQSRQKKRSKRSTKST